MTACQWAAKRGRKKEKTLKKVWGKRKSILLLVNWLQNESFVQRKQNESFKEVSRTRE
jgi:hypothetical protein